MSGQEQPDPLEPVERAGVPEALREFTFGPGTTAGRAPASPEQVRAALRAGVAQLRAEGHHQFGAGTLVDLRAELGVNRSVVFDALDALEAEGLIAECGPARWRIIG